MTSTFISLTIIALVAAVVPLIAKLIQKQLVPEPVLLIGAGAALGPHAMAVIHSNSEAIVLLSDLGCAFLFLLAGYEINPKALVGTDGKKGFATWVVTFLIGLGVAFIMPNIASGKQGLIATALLLTTTALGALMPILKERDITNTRVGELVIAYGTWGELATVLAVAILLSARTTWKTAIILGVLFLLCLWISMVGTKAVAMNSRLYRFIKSKAETTSQTIMRVTILLVIVLVAFSSAFDLDIVLGAFAAGFVLRFITAEANKTLEIKLNGLAHGFLIPLFFVISGCGIDAAAVANRPLLLLAFIVALILVRALPIIISLSWGKNKLEIHNRVSVAFYCTTALPLIVAITGIAVHNDVMDSEIASVLVAAGAISVFLMPYLGALTYSVVDAAPLDAVVEIIHAPRDISNIIHKHVELERERAREYREFADRKMVERLNAIENPEERAHMKALIRTHQLENRAFFEDQFQRRQRLHEKHQKEYNEAYQQFHDGRTPQRNVLESLEDVEARKRK